jgi:hypothetical protein
MRKECGPITDPQLHQQCLRVSVRTSLWSHRRHLTEGSPRPGTMQSNM